MNKEVKLSKEELAFQSDLKRLSDLIGGKEMLLPKKTVSTDILSEIASELLKEDREATAKEVKERLQNILKSYAKMNTEFAQKEDELKKLKINKMKEFSEAVKNLFKQVETLEKKEAEYSEGLAKATAESGSQEAEVEA